MIGVFLRHPSRFKSVPRSQSNIITRALSASVTNIDLKRASLSATLAPIPTPKDCDCYLLPRCRKGSRAG
jgi:hypothetical protein